MSKKKYIIPIFVPHAGCPHSCVFCNQKEITGQAKQPNAEEVREKITSYLRTMPSDSAVEVAFYGGSFTAISREKQKELLTPAFKALGEGLITDIRLSTRPDYIDDDILSFLTAYGVSIIELGVQSTDQDVLKLSQRGHSKEEVIKSANLIKSWGFTLGLQMMVGLPGDNGEKSRQTAIDIIHMEPDFVRIYPALVIKNTPLAEMYQQGVYAPLSLGKAVDICRDLLLLFEASDITVIRIGLQPSDEISLEGDVIAGPFHPAFRELVESAVAREQILYLLEQIPGEDRDITITINPADMSIVRGQKNSNINYLKEFWSVRNIKILTKEYLERGTIVMLTLDKNLVCPRKEFGRNLFAFKETGNSRF